MAERSSLTPIESALTPAESAAIKLADLHVLGLDFPPADWKLALPLYVEALSDLPLDLLHEAIRLWIRGSPKFPKPAELRAMVRDDLERRRERAAQSRAEAAELKQLPAPDIKRITPEEASGVLLKYGITLPERMQTQRVTPRYVEDRVPGQKGALR